MRAGPLVVYGGLMDTKMKGLRKVEWLDPDGNIHAALTEEVDLDDLMLALAAADPYDDGDFRWEGDPVTTVTGAGPGELWVGRWRCNPCNCGDEHCYDIAEASGKGLRGSYLGLMGQDYYPHPYYSANPGSDTWAGYEGY